MKYTIQINAPGQSRPACNGYQFIKAVLAEGHEIVRVFFYRDGIYNGFGGEGAAPDWSALAGAHGLDLVLCATAAERRGFGSSGPRAVAPRAGFRVGGLGQWMEACLKADRVLVFG